jgi:Mg-chelatase subunit ChlD
MRTKRLAIIGLLIISAIGIPFTLYIFSKQQEIRSKAEKSTILSLSPASTVGAPIQTSIGDTIPLDIIINPGTNAVSKVLLEILYDQTKFETTGDTTFQTNPASFPQIVEAPILTPGKITVTLSIGTDPTKVVQQTTRVGTINLKPLSTTSSNEATTSITFGANTQVLAIGTSPASNENVLSSTLPAIIAINPKNAPACSPKPACLNANPPCLVPEPVGGWCAPPAPTMTPMPTPIASCENAPADSIIIIDKSGSMSDRIGSSTTNKITSAKDAATNFTNILAINNQNKIGLISFGTNTSLNSGLTNDFNSIKNLISSLKTGGYTCHECAILKANQEFTSHGRSNIKKVAILLTDGKANWIEGGKNRASQSTAEQKALDAAKNAFNQNQIVFYTIGLGQDVNSNLLKQIADSTGGKYFFSPTTDDLQKIYQEISYVLAKGSINGFVFDDTNNNKLFDTNENKLSGWQLNLSSQNSSTKIFTSDQAGSYNINNLCDGTYTLKETIKPGWTQTAPDDPNGYTFTITNGNAITDKNFGNYMNLPTGTPVPTSAGTTITLNSLLDGIGSRGDNTNPDGNLSNKNPLHPERNISINIFNTSNQLIASSTGTMQYSSSSGSFKTTFTMTQPITTGSYTIKATTDTHLTRLLPGIQNITAGQNNELPNATFIAGDIMNNNKLDILDYNTLIGCYSDLLSATSCNDTQKTASDLNDDGAVNQFDYNLFLREIAIQPGQ